MQNEYDFKITYDLEKDTRNWITAAREKEFGGRRWKTGLYGYYLDEFDKISNMSDEEAKAELNIFIPAHFNDEIEAAQIKAQSRLLENFSGACKRIEQITGKKLAFQTVEFFLTTFPRAPYSVEDGSMYFCIFWDNIIDTFLHEMLHIQIHKYWRNNPDSTISKLGEDEFLALNEALTFLVDEPENLPARQSSGRYPLYSGIRKALKTHWRKDQDFESLLLFGADIVKKT